MLLHEKRVDWVFEKNLQRIGKAGEEVGNQHALRGKREPKLPFEQNKPGIEGENIPQENDRTVVQRAFGFFECGVFNRKLYKYNKAGH